jgi:hypothetical protein
MRSQPGRPATAEQATGTQETTYALVSVLEHALQGAETLVHDLQDAAAAGAQGLVPCLREAQVWPRHLASHAQAVLPPRWHDGEGRVWHPAATIWHLILMSSPDRGLPAERGAVCLDAPLGSVSPPLLRAPRCPLPRCGPRWRCTLVLLRLPYAGLVRGVCLTRSACG